MTKRRVANVMSQTACGYHGRKLIFIELTKLFSFICPAFCNGISYCLRQTATYGSHFKTMRESIVYEYRSRQREYLGLILEPAECGGKNDTVIISEKGGTSIPPTRRIASRCTNRAGGAGAYRTI